MSSEPKRTLRLGIMGGTFDPIHHGHLVAASEVASEYKLDEVIFVPTGQPWQKADREVTAAEHRYLLTVIATAANPRFSVSRVDIDRGGPTYTIDTLRDFRSMYPDAELFFITGADAMSQIMSWKNVEELWDLAHFVSVTRPGFVSEDFGRTDQISLMEIPAMAISSTDCRRRVHARKPVWYLVPDGVVQYIAKHRLYRGDGPAGDMRAGTGVSPRHAIDTMHQQLLESELEASPSEASPQEAAQQQAVQQQAVQQGAAG